MKVLSLSRAGLAQAVGVDKSVAGRWASGRVLPSAHNLAKLSRHIAETIPDFTMLDWDRPLSEFAERLKGGSSDPAFQAMATLLPLLPTGLAREASYAASERTKAYEGIWRTLRPSSDLPGHFLSDISLVRRDAEGHLRFR
ncbi:MAG: helix-turn-helix transcriptional regulator, partial [Pseudomonadota bacterium]